MIARLGVSTDNLDQPISVERRVRHDFLEEIRSDMAGAGVCQQQAARSQQFQRQQIDVLIAAAGLWQSHLRLGEPWRVQHDHVKTAATVAISPQHLEDIAFYVRDSIARQLIQRDIAAAEFENRSRGIDVGDVRGAAGQGGNGKAAGV